MLSALGSSPPGQGLSPGPRYGAMAKPQTSVIGLGATLPMSSHYCQEVYARGEVPITVVVTAADFTQ